MKRYRRIIWITIILALIAASAVFAYGKMVTGQQGERNHFDAMNDYDWSKACPAASCRNHNEE